MKKIIYLLILLGLAFTGYNVAYQTPDEKKMANLFATRPSVNQFTDGFEKVKRVKDLFADDYSRWHELVLQNNTRTIKRPIKRCMLSVYECEIDKSKGNYIELDESNKFGGRYSLKFHAEPFDPKFFGDSKIAIRRQLFDFKKGHEIYFSAWMYLEDNAPNSREHQGLAFVGFRAPFERLRYLGEPGRRVGFQDKNIVYSDTDNWLPQPPIFTQDSLEQIHFPEDKWVNVRVYMKLSDQNDGRLDVWQDGKKVLSGRGATLPESSTVYSIMELGILNNQNQEHAQTLYMDDVWVSGRKFPTD